MRTSGVIKRAFRDTLPVMTGYIVLGLGFGILLSTKGYNALWALFMCLVIYSGTMQFVAIDLFTSGASLTESGLTSLMVSARHLFYGLSMIERYKNISLIKKFYMIFALTDETYSLVCESDDENYCFWVSLLDHSYWTFGSVSGAVLGQVLPFDSRGIDFSLTALFVSICVEQWLNNNNHYSSLTGFAASILCLIIFGSENFLIPSMILITLTLFIMRERIEATHE
ncbi:MAG: AzlC family ABC transporter permease [Synergistaceae bacterium]|nr:AzlC family ABC transporter permease [Synergistaceae bacterium]